MADFEKIANIYLKYFEDGNEEVAREIAQASSTNEVANIILKNHQGDIRFTWLLLDSLSRNFLSSEEALDLTFKRNIDPTEGSTLILYHVSPIRNEKSILKYGLNYKRLGPLNPQKIEFPGVFVTNDLEALFDLLSLEYSEGRLRGSKNFSIFEIKVPPNVTVSSDPFFNENSFIIRGEVPPSYIKLKNRISIDELFEE